jgi:hypothetical protein
MASSGPSSAAGPRIRLAAELCPDPHDGRRQIPLDELRLEPEHPIAQPLKRPIAPSIGPAPPSVLPHRLFPAGFAAFLPPHDTATGTRSHPIASRQRDNAPDRSSSDSLFRASTLATHTTPSVRANSATARVLVKPPDAAIRSASAPARRLGPPRDRAFLAPDEPCGPAAHARADSERVAPSALGRTGPGPHPSPRQASAHRAPNEAGAGCTNTCTR